MNLTIQTYPGEGDGLDGAIVGQDPNLHVFIDGDIDPDRQAAAFLHEMLHLWHGDKQDPRPLEEIEAERAAELRRIGRLFLED